jgi:hypothetical protein
VIDSLPKFKSLLTASVMFVNGGENDLLIGDSVESIAKNWQVLLNGFPKGKKLVCVGLPEPQANRVNSLAVKPLNELIADVCRKNQAQFLAIQIGRGEFIVERLATDNLHLSRPASIKLAKLME